MAVDEREVVALFGTKLKEKLKEDVSKLIHKMGVKLIGVSEKKIKDGFHIIFNCDSKKPVDVGVYLLYVNIEGVKTRKIKIRFRPFTTGVSKEIYEEISEKDWKKKGLKIIESGILDFVKHAIEKRFILYY